jgi:antitoxin Phd
MKSIDEAEAQARLDEILEEAQRQPIVITRQGQDTAVVVSIADDDRFRTANVESFFQLRREVASEAEASGLTEERLAKLLNDRKA